MVPYRLLGPYYVPLYYVCVLLWCWGVWYCVVLYYYGPVTFSPTELVSVP